jgi:hypothetical protein
MIPYLLINMISIFMGVLTDYFMVTTHINYMIIGKVFAQVLDYVVERYGVTISATIASFIRYHSYDGFNRLFFRVRESTPPNDVIQMTTESLYCIDTIIDKYVHRVVTTISYGWYMFYVLPTMWPRFIIIVVIYSIYWYFWLRPRKAIDTERNRELKLHVTKSRNHHHWMMARMIIDDASVHDVSIAGEAEYHAENQSQTAHQLQYIINSAIINMLCTIILLANNDNTNMGLYLMLTKFQTCLRSLSSIYDNYHNDISEWTTLMEFMNDNKRAPSRDIVTVPIPDDGVIIPAGTHTINIEHDNIDSDSDDKSEPGILKWVNRML